MPYGKGSDQSQISRERRESGGSSQRADRIAESRNKGGQSSNRSNTATAAEIAAHKQAAASMQAAGVRGVGDTTSPAVQAMADAFNRQLQKEWYDKWVAIESGGNPTAKNPMSSATGPAQITAATARAVGVNPADVTNPAVAQAAMAALNQSNAAVLEKKGIPSSQTNLAIAARFGAGTGGKVINADKNAPISSVVGDDVMRANPDLKNKNGTSKTVGEITERYGNIFGGSSQQVAPSQGAKTSPTFDRFSSAGAVTPGPQKPEPTAPNAARRSNSSTQRASNAFKANAARAQADYDGDDDDIFDTIGNLIAGSWGFNEMDPTKNPNSAQSASPALAGRANWGFDPVVAAGGIASAVTGVPGGGLLADLASRAAGRPLEIDVGPQVIGSVFGGNSTSSGNSPGRVSERQEPKQMTSIGGGVAQQQAPVQQMPQPQAGPTPEQELAKLIAEWKARYPEVSFG